MNIAVKKKEVYGKSVYYPVDPKAQIFAEIAGTKTLTLETINRIKALGYTVNLVADPATI